MAMQNLSTTVEEIQAVCEDFGTPRTSLGCARVAVAQPYVPAAAPSASSSPRKERVLQPGADSAWLRIGGGKLADSSTPHQRQQGPRAEQSESTLAAPRSVAARAPRGLGRRLVSGVQHLEVGRLARVSGSVLVSFSRAGVVEGFAGDKPPGGEGAAETMAEEGKSARRGSRRFSLLPTPLDREGGAGPTVPASAAGLTAPTDMFAALQAAIERQKPAQGPPAEAGKANLCPPQETLQLQGKW